MTDLRVLVVADNLLARVGLAALLAEQTTLDVVGQVAAGETLTDDLDVYRPDVIVWDFGWQQQAAVERFAGLLNEFADNQPVPVVALLPDASRAGEMAGYLRLMPNGGGVLSAADPPQLAAALQAAAGGLLVIDPLLADEILPDAPLELPAEALTQRELEVLQLLAEGLANKNIAQRLGISDHTVKFHVNAIMSKLDTQSRTGAVVRAMRLGLIAL